ncbi:EAL domain-containing protein [Thiomicrorhabdus cannonii]|uniref:EAL domain-containing protein n=1 Tax=Thiomicrorhabdus cannonii TaxID=2748011 RepID=UPI0015BC02F6|nr:EAL domain-containing protein [Thiomicrorhabdus cannonii]
MTLQNATHRFIGVMLLWTGLILASLGYNFYSLWQATLKTAESAALAALNKDLSYRNWATSHGGVYVPPTERTPPNPYLNVPGKNVMTTDGQALTLMNPAYMLREMQLYFADQYGTKTVITSLNPINPNNVPDEWETAALNSFEIKPERVQSLGEIDGETHLRMMVPFIVEAPCLKCHAQQGYKVGDVRGGIAAYLPMKPLLQHQTTRRIELSISHAVVWLIGLFGFSLAWRHQLKLDQANANIQHLAHYDNLTQLPNRHLIEQTLAQHTQTHPGGRLGLILLDIDNFKLLNDTLGHKFGDKLLQAVSGRLNEFCANTCFAGRLSGDEFVVMLPKLKRSVQAARLQLEETIRLLLDDLDRPYLVEQRDYQITVSLGGALALDEKSSHEELLKFAEVAMYQAKLSGRNTYKLFEESMLAQITARSELEKDLRTAVLENNFELYYQPQVDEHGQTTGAEALLRWHHPQRGLLAPNVFMSMAEECGLILPIGQWVMQSACQTLYHWQQHPALQHLTLAVNVSAHQFYQADFVEQVTRALQSSGAPANKLKLELTESLFVADIQQVMQKMRELKTLGIAISLDDFGTGYSSLSYLKRLPLDQLKIDQSFVRDILEDPNDAAIARMVITLAQELQLNVIAEGVETQEQQKALATLGCLHYQGYLFGRPQPLAEFEQTLP